MDIELNDNQYLLNYRKDFASQFGEDGIIEKIFDLLPAGDHWCVEFGAWDGKFCSNTYHLLSEKNWSGILIEGNPKRITDLKNTYKNNPKVFPINKYVNFKGDDILDNILAPIPIPVDFDFLSIDIDGNDYHIWKSLVKYQPKLVLIEFNASIPGDVEFVQPADLSLQQGSSILSFVKLAKEKGYELICINQVNAFFVHKKYFERFGIQDNSIKALKHFKEPLQVFQLYDGTMVFHGAQSLYFYNVPVDFNKKLQVLPRFLRHSNLVWSNNQFYRFIFRLYKLFFLKKSKSSMTDDEAQSTWSWIREYKSFLDNKTAE